MKHPVRFFTPVLIALAFVIGWAGHASAYSQTKLMDDQVFDNVGSLSSTQVADFLAGRSGPFTKLSSASPCLSSYTSPNFYWDNVKWHYGSDADWNTSWGPAQIPASTVIAQAAAMWGLNPEVIIATLQKEESLITGTSCDGWRYNSAMGYGCPDSGGCNPRYVGFNKQVLWGAWQLKFNKERSYGNTAWDGDDVIMYVGYMTQGTRKRCGTCASNYYDGYATPDGQSTYMENGTTASLYTYTPHLGNSTPVNFEQWFGPAVLPSYSWAYAGQTSSKDLTNLPVGQKAVLTVSARNTGTATWTNSGPNPMHLGTSRPNDRSSAFNGGTWLGGTRPANLNESSVAPGATGTFSFTIQAPNAPGTYNEYFNLVDEGLAWLNDPGLFFPIHVVPAVLSSSVTQSNLTTAMHTDATATITLKLHNTGNVTWYKDGLYPVYLGTANPNDRTSVFASPSWLGATRPAKLTEAQVDPGSDGTYTFTITAPHAPGTFTEAFSQVAEGAAWFNQPISGVITVQGTYTATGTANNQSLSMVAGSSKSITLSFQNTGTATWSNSGTNPVKLGTTNPQDRVSPFCDASWSGCTRAATLTETSVAPGATGTFTFTLKSSPLQFGNYSEAFLPVAEGQEWFGTPATLSIDVAPPTYTWSLVGQSAYTDSTKTTSVDLASLSPGQTAWLVLQAKNTGNVAWQKGGANPIRVGAEGPEDRASIFATNAWYGTNRPVGLTENSVAPDANGTFEFPVNVPAVSGNYFERFNLLAEGVTWMNNIGLGYSMTVNKSYSWSLVSQYAYTDNTKTTAVDLSQLTPGQTAFIGFVATNTGTSTWYNSGSFPARAGSSHPQDRSSAFATASWIAPNRPVTLKEATVRPGQSGTFEFIYTAPATKGYYYEYFQPMVEGVTWMNDPGMNFATQVK